MAEVLTLKTLPSGWDDPVFTAEQAAALLATPHHTLLTIGETAHHGHLLLSHMPDMPADILTLYVPPTARRCGHARTLVEAALVAAKNAGCQALTLEVNATNAAAVALYTVCGLQQIAKRASYYPSSVSNLKADALVLSVPLA